MTTYQINSNYYGQLSSASTIELAIYKAENMRKDSGEIITVYLNGVKMYEAKN